MTWTQTLSDGIGGLEFRLEIQGWPYQFVSHPDLEQNLSDGRIRIACLSREGIEWSEFVDIPKAEMDGSAPVFRFIQTWDDANDLMLMLAPVPNFLVYLSTSVDHSDTIWTVEQDGEAWDPASGGPEYVYIGDECIKATAISSTTDGSALLTCTRGARGTTGRAHFAITYQAVNATSPVITDVPYTMEGLWAKLHVYGEGDDPQGDGTQVWRGFVANDARYDGQTGWSIQCEPTHERLNEEMLSDAGETIGIRGVNTYVNARIVLNDATTIETSISGFWETQQDFISDYSDFLEEVRTASGSTPAFIGTDVEISSSYTGSTSSMSSVGISLFEVYEEDGSVSYSGGNYNGPSYHDLTGRWSFRWTITGTPSVTLAYVDTVLSGDNYAEPVFSVFSSWASFYTDAGVFTNLLSTATPPTSAGTYRIIASPADDNMSNAGRVPRMNVSTTNPNTGGTKDRVYISRVPTVNTTVSPCVVVRYEDQISDLPIDASVEVEPATGYISENVTALTLNTTLSGAAETSVVVTAWISGGTPQVGSLLIELDSGAFARVNHTAWSGSTFVIESTDFSSDNATSGNSVTVRKIPEVMTPTAWYREGGYDDLQSAKFSGVIAYGFDIGTGSPEDPQAIEYDTFFAGLSNYSQNTSVEVLPPLYTDALGTSWQTASPTEDWSFREYSYAEPASFWDIASPILLMHKLVPYYDTSGELQVQALRTGGYDHIMDESDVLLPNDGAPAPTFERSGMVGAISKYIVTQNANPFTGDLYGPTVIVRNLRVLSSVGNKRTIEVEWLPFAGERDSSSVTSIDLNYVPTDEDISEHFATYIEMFGLGAYTLTFALPLSYFDMVIGDRVRVSVNSLPDPLNGGFGIISSGFGYRDAIIIGRDVDLSRGFVNFTAVGNLATITVPS